MRKMLHLPARYALGLALLVALVAAVFALAPHRAISAAAPIDDLAQSKLAADGRANVFIKMAAEVDLSAAESLTDRVTRLNYVHDALTALADSSQKDVKAFLDSQGVRYHSFWINNSVYIWDASPELVNTLAQRSDIAYIRGEHMMPLHQPVEVREAASEASAIEWGIDLVNAPDVWAQGNTGVGIVVSNVDTGARWTHDAIDGQYRGSNGDHNYDWWDPQESLPAPNDGFNHGTHTIGTMVGDDGGSNQIGVAPGAQWIAAQGCNNFGSCPDFDLTSSAEFIACPTDLSGNNPNCSLAPHVVNNSWGDSFGGDPWYQSYVNAWIAADIMPVFSAGNNGPSCQSMGSPGDYRNVIGVGAIDINSVLASFSSRGRGDFRRQKPDVVAPGDNVRSASNSGDNAYITFDGTSMAAPHVAGTIALMLADSPGTTLQTLVTTLTSTAANVFPNPPNPDTCNNRSYTADPNYHYGHGRIDALAAVNDLP